MCRYIHPIPASYGFRVRSPAAGVWLPLEAVLSDLDGTRTASDPGQSHTFHYALRAIMVHLRVTVISLQSRNVRVRWTDRGTRRGRSSKSS